MDYISDKQEWKVLEHMLPNTIRYILTKYPGCILAGGSVLSMFMGTAVNDWDIFVDDPKTIQKIVTEYIQPTYPNSFTNPKSGNFKTVLRQNFISGTTQYSFIELLVYGQKIQLIYHRWKEAKDIFSTFDIEVAKFAISFDTSRSLPKMQLHYTTRAMDDFRSKKISLGRIKRNVVNQIERIKKYEAKGFIMTNDEWLTFFKKVKEFSDDDLSAGILGHLKDSENYKHLESSLPSGIIRETKPEEVHVCTEDDVGNKIPYSIKEAANF